ncbi:AzlD domain-containing protein [Serpentinicella sp. ANB-PHB4]|uniref:AzlD domain-containing protein n=1 Tax=Serpentinicella sp. ANB-PHB4 TaxID=3074076 RepID=UPI0028600A21|nr:AzlD domain-containing protein [Serpentinicella sp. ANB-PHB4]MDR5659435.1 AzlD domain-containing protein [Serpentinicella sp. ANB-PHB4]
MRLYMIIIGMAFVTYLPRLLPVFIVDHIKLPKRINLWLKMIPFAALGALIFPGVLSVEEGVPLVGFIGAVVATIAAYFKLHIFYVIFSSILSVMIVKFIFIN